MSLMAYTIILQVKNLTVLSRPNILYINSAEVSSGSMQRRRKLIKVGNYSVIKNLKVALMTALLGL